VQTLRILEAFDFRLQLSGEALVRRLAVGDECVVAGHCLTTPSYSEERIPSAEDTTVYRKLFRIRATGFVKSLSVQYFECDIGFQLELIPPTLIAMSRLTTSRYALLIGFSG